MVYSVRPWLVFAGFSHNYYKNKSKPLILQELGVGFCKIKNAIALILLNIGFYNKP